jgi:hypothetical protein
MMVHAFHPLGRPIQVHLRGGAGADVEVETVHATRDVAEAAVEAAVEADTASSAPMNALSLLFRTVAVPSVHWALRMVLTNSWTSRTSLMRRRRKQATRMLRAPPKTA